MSARPRRAVVKRDVTDAGCRYVKTFSAREHYRRERSALQWLSTVNPDAVPELIQHDDATMTLVTAEVRGHTLRDLPSRRRAAAMLRLADRLGRIAEVTMSFTQKVPASGVLNEMPSGYRAGRQATLALGAPADATKLAAELDVIDTVLQSGVQSLQIGDICPDNVIARGAHAVLIDWEFAYVGPSMMDLAAVTVSHFPTCRIGVQVGSNLAQRMIDHWTATNGAALDPRALTAAQIQWALITTGELLDLERAGEPTRRIVADRAMRLRHRCRGAATAAVELGLPGLHRLLLAVSNSPAPVYR